MQDEDLIRMANQIAAFFEPYPRDEAAAGAAEHIGLFWDPRMRRQLYIMLDRGGEGLSPLALEAARRQRTADAEKAAPEGAGGHSNTGG